MSRRIVYLALAVFLWALPLEPAQADTMKFQGWMRNLSGSSITVQRITAECWNPQQLAYQQIPSGNLWAFASEARGGDVFLCNEAIGFISANVFDQNNNLLFWFQMFDNYNSEECYIFLFNPGTTNVFAALPTTSCGDGDTISFTMFVTGSSPPASIVKGLQ
jgi:hypothetical protein